MFSAPVIRIGEGSHRLAASYAEKLGAKKVLLITDEGVARAGWSRSVLEGFAEKGVAAVVFDEVSANPRDEQVMAGARAFKDEECDALVAVGGGSPMDCAKGIGLVASSGRHILAFEGVDKVEAPPPPLICVPTTSGTAADVSRFAIVTDTHRKVKIAIIDKATVPSVSLTDPLPTTTMPADLAAATGMDALAHACEAYVSTGRSAPADLHALEAVSLVFKNLAKSVSNANDLVARGAMSMASLHAGLAFSNAGLGLVHAMAHGLGGLLDLPHGECNAILLEHVMAYNFSEAGARYRRVAEAAGVQVAGATDRTVLSRLVEAVGELRHSVGLDRGLASLGVGMSDIRTLARNAVKDACATTNPKRASQDEIERIYERAL